MTYTPPKNMKDLEKVYYCNNAEEMNRHGTYFRNPNNWKSGLNNPEQNVKYFLEQIGNVIKINEDNQSKLPDFEVEIDTKKIEGKNLFVEVKSINTVYGNPVGNFEKEINIKCETDFINKINLTLTDICEKDVEKNNLYIGVIWLDVIQHFFTKVYLDKNFIDKTNFSVEKVDGLLIFFERVGGNVEDKKHVLFSKNKKIVKLFNDLRSETKIIEC